LPLEPSRDAGPHRRREVIGQLRLHALDCARHVLRELCHRRQQLGVRERGGECLEVPGLDLDQLVVRPIAAAQCHLSAKRNIMRLSLIRNTAAELAGERSPLRFVASRAGAKAASRGSGPGNDFREGTLSSPEATGIPA